MKNRIILTAGLLFVLLGCKKEEKQLVIGWWYMITQRPFSGQTDGQTFEPSCPCQLKQLYFDSGGAERAIFAAKAKGTLITHDSNGNYWAVSYDQNKIWQWDVEITDIIR